MRARHRVLTAFFTERTAAAAALTGLVQGGIPRDSIHLLARRLHAGGDLGVRPGSRLAAGAALGAAAGVVLGAVAGALGAGGAVIIPSLDAFLAGPLVSAIAGAGAASTIGVATGALIGACVPAFEATYVDDASRGALLAVRVAKDRVPLVVEILAANGAHRIARRPSR
ncbi:Hypothetical protein A7982_11278 [Minicystis rosea]|nr:Hypothetical protein A7982_11278 [Minicystis rosea]